LENEKIYLHKFLLIMNIIELQYFGTIGFIKTLIKEENIYLDSSAPYTKMSFKNRMVIATAQGPLHLSIPIIGGRDQKTVLKDVKIAYDYPWNEHHYKAIVSSYQRAPYFEYYKDDLKLIFQLKPKFLNDWLMHTQEWVKKQLKGNWNFVEMESSSKLMEAKTNQLIADHQSWTPKNYFLQSNGIIYQQVFEDRIGFQPNLCVIDLLFCCGGKQANYLLSM